jgi:hypothetical protein
VNEALELVSALVQELEEREWDRQGEPYRPANYCAACGATGQHGSDVPQHKPTCRFVALTKRAREFLSQNVLTGPEAEVAEQCYRDCNVYEALLHIARAIGLSNEVLLAIRDELRAR